VVTDRQYLIDAAIVRILKNKKSIIHNDLLNDVFNEMKLPITVTCAFTCILSIYFFKVVEVKKRIESLINRDYISRDKDNIQVYHYVA